MTQFNLEEEYKLAAKKLAEDIDFTVISDLLVENGWVKVTLEFDDRHHSVDINTWVEYHCQGKHMKRGGTFVFEDSRDALLFELKWL